MGGGIDCEATDPADGTLARPAPSGKPFDVVAGSRGGDAELGPKEMTCEPGLPSSFFLLRPSQLSRML